MIINQSVSLAFWLSIIYPVIAIILATFLFAWSRERVLTWQQRTYRKFMVSRRGIKRLIKQDLASKPDLAHKHSPHSPIKSPNAKKSDK